jgi:hypothetical protein
MNGAFVYNSSRSNIEATKTIDAKNGNDFISLKYVQDAGGAQDNQVNDVKKFLEEAIKYTENNKNNYTFTAIVDGEYIESKILELKQFTNDKVKIHTSDTYKTV